MAAATRTVKDFYPKAALQMEAIRGLQKTLDEALQYERITEKRPRRMPPA